MLDIDGAYGEGGGQLVRSACALSAITGRAIRVRAIRARRTPPGLAPQHLAAVKAVAALCDAEVAGLELGARDITFRPRTVRGGEFRFDVGTAGSITLVLQAVLPVAIAARTPCDLHITGGTDVRAAPPIDYVRAVLLALLARMGASIEIEVRRRGYYPRGGGAVHVRVAPATLRPLQLDSPGPLVGIAGAAHVSHLPAHIAERMAHAAQACLQGWPCAIERQGLTGAEAIGQGGAIVLWANTVNTVLGAAAVAERGVPAEQIGARAGAALRTELASGATLDLYASDQLLIYLALADGPSRFVARALSAHAATTLWLLPQLLPVRVTSEPAGSAVRIALVPGAPGAPGHGSGAAYNRALGPCAHR